MSCGEFVFQTAWYPGSLFSPFIHILREEQFRQGYSEFFNAGETLMRVLLVADIHGNWPALQAINEQHDLCLCLGDLVDYALEPAPCVDWVRNRAHYAVRGNHDHGVA